jgi:hypothetical protein
MDDQSAPRAYGWRVGLVAAVFSVAQALVLYGAALGAYGELRSIQHGLNLDQVLGQVVVDPTLTLSDLLPMLFVSYGSMLVAGIVTLLLARAAGRMTAIATGRHAGGARAGMWVWLVSTFVWLAASAVVVVVTHLDGTVTGIFSGTGKPEFTGDQLLGLLGQEIVFALIWLGFCALAGSRGAATATLVDPAPAVVYAPAGMAMYPFAMAPAPWATMPPPPQFRPGPQGPQAGLPPYPGAYPPPALWAPPQPLQPAYPPLPSHYGASPAPQPPQLPASGSDQSPAQTE